ncbi:MAG: hypothetical protein B7Y25_06915 [Alphaproteobacteria bacterium 16-39-46]|nr:MAG: hypothetical protein B7Y25_06915 [Alphaproteobacteria bacterium 16-39-46]OZA42143.1 MAG: hypothetical protein B7X84_06855 [Alphaproteobacteria bacterium 17-39-52]HQS84632.1 nucleotidyltransferase domain-containing protein [Alphaproteobacteria bacterium]HQS94444.1 nucleotidyltransferase domain-containing protein [Alphaproteobacteria bacterium]
MPKGCKSCRSFGSYARGQQGPLSDINILIELNPNDEIDIFSYVALKEQIANFFDCPVDVVHRVALKKELRGCVEKAAAYAF